MRDKPVIFFTEGDEQDSTPPEIKLWINVAERAMQDFCNFYYWYADRSLDTGGKAIKDCTRKRLFFNMAENLNELEWFLFCPVPTEFNLTWIFEHCGEGSNTIDDNAAILSKLRKEMRVRHHSNYQHYKDHPLIAPKAAWFEARIKRAEKRPTKYLKKIRWRVH